MLNSGEPDVTLEHVPSLPASIVREKKDVFYVSHLLNSILPSINLGQESLWDI